MAATTRTSTWTVRSAPTGSTSPSCRTRSTLAWVRADMSPISSRKIVPPSAATNLPVWRRSAPVKLPFSWPKSSDSISSSGIAAQLTWTNGRSRRGEWRWMARATSSLPVPLSPVMRTVAGVGAAFSIVSRRRFIARALPIKASLSGRKLRFSACRRALSVAFRSDSSTRSRCSGFSKKS